LEAFLLGFWGEFRTILAAGFRYSFVLVPNGRLLLKTTIMKPLKLLFLLVFLPATFYAQQRMLTGLWTGELTNDSVTVKKDLSFEIALTQYKDKVYGYSRRTFIVNDTLYYVLKRVKGKVDGEVCEVTDVEYVSFNFPGKVDKGVKITYTFRLNEKDSSWNLDGNWSTNKVKRQGFYAIGGRVGLQEEKDFANSKIFAHLEELTLGKDVPFYAASKKPVESNQPPKNIALSNKKEDAKKTAPADVSKTTTPDSPVSKQNKEIIDETTETATNKQDALVKKEDTPQEETVTSVATKKSDLPPTTLQAEEKKDVGNNLSKPEVKKQGLPLIKQEPVLSAVPDEPKTTTKKSDLPAANIQTEQKKDVANNLSKPEVKKQELPVIKQEPVLPAVTDEPKTTTKKSDLVTTAKTTEEKKFTPGTSQPTPAVKIAATAAAFVQERKTVAPQFVTFKSDSLELALYDNGEIDGDTVSVLLNGEIFMAKQGLKASAIKKTIYIQPGSEEITLVLYAENLGRYAPNTGLLVVHDGEDTYQIRFSADLQQNAAVVFRRKK
jgi:hypothetical protein